METEFFGGKLFIIHVSSGNYYTVHITLPQPTSVVCNNQSPTHIVLFDFDLQLPQPSLTLCPEVYSETLQFPGV